jgi:hypothetical protein
MPLKTVGDAMHEFKAGDLHSGKGGPVVQDRKQAIAIGLSSQRRAQGKQSFSGKKTFGGGSKGRSFGGRR